MEESQTIENEVQEAEVQENQTEETETPQTKQEAPKLLETEIEIGDKKYKINEVQLKQLYGIDPNEPLTQKEFKTMVSAYKSQKTADLKSNESAKYKSIISELSELIQNNPFELLQRAGYNPRELAEQYLYEQLQEEALPESEKELKRTKQELEILRKQQEEFQKQKQEQEFQAYVQYEQQNLENQIMQGLQNSSLPKTPEVVQRIAKYMLLAEEKNVPVTVAHVLPLVEEDIRNYNQQILKSLDPQNRMKYIGDDLLNELRKQDIARVKTMQSNGSSKPQVKSEPKKGMTKEEWRQYIAQKVKS